MNLYQPTITGSLSVSGSVNISGSITIAGGGTISGTASYATNAELLDGLDSTVFTLTSSFAAQTASFTAFTASILGQTASLNSFSASVLTYTSSLNAKTASFATTGSNTFIGTQTISGSILQSGSFTSTGTLTAQTLVVQTITSSVVYSSGSNVFGNSAANTQVFTGSVYMNPGGLFVSSSGAVGIGVIPTQTSSLVFADTLSSKILLNNNANNYRIDLTSSINGGDAMMKFIAGSTTAGEFSFYTTTNLRMIITSGGNVGIGTTSPNQKLEVWGTTRNYAGVGYYSDFAYNGTTYNFANTEATDNVDFKIAGGGTFTTGGNFRFWTQPGNTTPVERMRITSSGTVQPGANGTQDLGTSSLRWSTIYTSDLDMSNGVGDYTIVEGEEDLFLYNNKTNKVFKFVIQEVDPSTATPKMKKS